MSMKIKDSRFALEFNNTINKIILQILDKMKLLKGWSATVKTANNSTQTAELYLAGDNSTVTSTYLNRTGQDLTNGDLVYLVSVDGTLNNAFIGWKRGVYTSSGGATVGDMLKTIYDTNNSGVVDNAEKVNGFTVGKSVPSNAKFTDTTYSAGTNVSIDSSNNISAIDNDTITTINGKTGAIAKSDITALGIPAQDTVYTHPTTAGNKHLPTGGAVGQVLKNTASGTATWQADNDTITSINGKTGVIAKADIVALGIPAQDTVIDISNKVDKITGKALSTNDFTNLLKTKLDGVEAGAEKNKVNSVNSKVGTVVLTGADIKMVGAPDSITIAQEMALKADKTQVLTNVPEGALFTDTIYSHPATHPYSMITGTPTKLPADGGDADTVNGKTVEANVPSTAKFTDTNTVTTINGKTGTIAKADIVALGIPAQDTVYTHPTTAGNKHLPAGGAVGQVLKNTASGTATWQADNDTITSVNGKTGVIAKADIVALGIPAQDTVYSHPTSHPASMITGLPTKLSELNNDKGFITIEDIPSGETQITIRHQERFIVGTSSIFEFTKGYYTLNANSVNWYLDGIKQSNDTLVEINNRTIEVVGGLPQGSTVVFDYVEYTNTVIGLEGPEGPKGEQGLRGLSGTTSWNGITDKPSSFSPSAHTHTKSQVGLGSVDNIKQATKVEFDSHHSDTTKHILSTERTNWNAKETTTGSQNKANQAEQNAKDYTDGKVLTDVPLNAKFTDTVYSHPTSHPASMIEESVTKRFVTDVEKANWDSVADKVDKVAGKDLSSEDYTTEEKQKLEGIEQNANHTPNLTLTELTLGGRFKVVYNDIEDSLDFEVI